MNTKPLSILSDIQTGPFGSQLHKEDYVAIGTPIVTVEHLGNRVFTEQNLPMVSDADRDRLKKYVLKETDGKVALIILNPDGKNTVYKTYDISVGTLPEADRMKLKEGIEAESLSEALLMVEDYL